MVVLSSDQQRIIEELYKQMLKALTGYAQTILGNHALAEEAVQETFQLACLKINELLSHPNPRGWLKETLKNVIHNIQKKQEHTAKLFVAEALDENIAAEPQGISVETKVTCVETVGEENYNMLKRVALKESTIQDTAKEFGLSADACGKRIQRSKKKLQDVL